MKLKSFLKHKYVVFFWFSLWLIQSFLMSNGSELEFYLIKNIVIVGLQFIVVLVNYKWLFPVFFERKNYVLYVILSMVIVYLVFTLSFFFMDIMFSIIYPNFLVQGSIVFPLDFWVILSGSSFYSLALVCSLVYFLLKKNQKSEGTNLELKKQLDTKRNIAITIKEGHKIHKVLLEDIYYVKGLREYVVWHTKNGKIIELQTMNNIERDYKENGLLRVHKSYIVNMEHVSSFERNLLKVNDETIPIGRTHKERIKTYMEYQIVALAQE